MPLRVSARFFSFLVNFFHSLEPKRGLPLMISENHFEAAPAPKAIIYCFAGLVRSSEKYQSLENFPVSRYRTCCSKDSIRSVSVS